VYLNTVLLWHKALTVALIARRKFITSMETNKTTGCQICNCFPSPNILGKFMLNWQGSERKCPACGKNCGKPALLDLFCGGGGASRGYQEAGFCVFGVDIKPQPRYIGCGFHQGDALEYCAAHGHEFDAIHASPPCQKFSAMTNGRWKDRATEHLDLVDPVRELLISLGKPYVIENVVGAPLRQPLLLCGTMFGLQTDHGSQLLRHRLFELSWGFEFSPSTCLHKSGSAIGVYGGGQNPARKRVPSVIGVYGLTGGTSKRSGKSGFGVDDRRTAMGIEWMTNKELSQAIPPAYTEYIGGQLLQHLEAL